MEDLHRLLAGIISLVLIAAAAAVTVCGSLMIVCGVCLPREMPGLIPVLFLAALALWVWLSYRIIRAFVFYASKPEVDNSENKTPGNEDKNTP